MLTKHLCGAAILAACLAGPARADGPIPMGVTGQFHLVFDDEMNEPQLDTTKWLTKFWYKNTDANAYMSPSSVTMAYGAAWLGINNATAGAGPDARPHTGSVINTHGKFRFTYGIFEVRAKMIGGGPGIDSGAFLINDSGTGHDVWPPEIDLIEVLSASPSMALMTVHWGPNGENHQSAGWYKGADLSAQMHVYTVDWQPNSITWYIDGTQRYFFADAANIPNLPLYIVIDPVACDLAGSWCGSPMPAGLLPAQMAIDYVRVWQR